VGINTPNGGVKITGGRGDRAFCRIASNSCCISLSRTLLHLTAAEMWHLAVCVSCLLILGGATVRRADALLGADISRTGSDRPRMPELLREDDRALVDSQRVRSRVLSS